jgi:hypothetical protein
VINFPDNPTVGQAFSSGGTNYTCISTAPIVWNASPAAAPVPDAPVDGLTYGRKDAAWKALTKVDVGLTNVDNTSDMNKPVSTAQAAAIATKEPVIVIGTAAQYYRGDKTWQALNKAAVGLPLVDNTADASKTVQSALYVRSGANAAGALIPFSWVDDSTAPTYIWGGTNTNGQVYYKENVQIGRATTAGNADNANAVNGISGWNYSNRAKNPVYMWVTDGGSNDQYLTQPGNISVAYAGTAGYCSGTSEYANRAGVTNSIEGSSGGTLQSDTAVNGNLWSNNGFVRSFTGFKCRGGNGGGEGGNVFNFYWDGGAGNINVYIDYSFMGAMGFKASDERIKQRIMPLEQDREAYLMIKPIRFGYRNISLWEDNGSEHWGWSAQNLATCVPKAVLGGFDQVTRNGEIQPASIDDGPIMYLTVLEVQALIAEVADLKTRITALEAK